MFEKSLFLIATLVMVLNATPLLKTGQTLSYDGSGAEINDGSVKDDGYYQKGITRNYSRIGDIVIDNITGLQWQDNEIVLKPWLTQSKYDAGDYNNTTGDTAATYCSELSLATYDDWRLPDIQELETLVDYNRSEGAYSYTANVFNNKAQAYFWSSTTNVHRDSFAWQVDFTYGKSEFLVNEKYESSSSYTRCVRGKHLDEPSLSTSNEVVSDVSTLLQWQDNEQGEFVEKEWSNAIDYCETLSLDDHHDWRLPNIKELLSIADRSNYSSALDPVFANFDPNYIDYTFWSSTSVVSGESDAWYVNFYYGEADDNYKANAFSVRCVRDIPVEPVIDSQLLKTGQTISYDVDGNGNIVTDGSVKDDGYYQAGVTRSYSRNNNIVTDNVTGLQWQDNETVEKPWLTQSKYDAGDYNNTAGDTAATYCSELSLGTYGDWRLPNIKELETLVNYRQGNPSSIDNVFQHIAVSNLYYWSSSTYGGSTSEARYIEFKDRISNYIMKSTSYSVRCVRGQRLNASDFSRNANGVVSDATTKLQWQDNVLSENRTWGESIDYCEGLSLDDNNDWRLPNINELHSIMERIEHAYYGLNINPIFVNIGDGSSYYDYIYWSSTTKDNIYGALTVAFRDGISDYYNYSHGEYARCVRGGQLDKLKSPVIMVPIIMYLLN